MDRNDLAGTYDSYYFQTGCGPIDYHNHEVFQRMFDRLAQRMVSSLNMGKVLDAGCAMGYLVAALRRLGVEAYGIDISDYAIAQVPAEVRPFCRVGSVTEPFGDRFDLIVCIEVLEHLPGSEPMRAVENLCQHADDVIFSSTPLDFKEATHFNVHPTDYWAELFARNGFVRDVDYDLAFLTPWAMRFRRTREPLGRTVASYERRLWHLQQEVQGARNLALEQRSEMATQQGQINSLREEMAKKDQRILQLNEQIQAKDNQLNGTNQRFASLESQIQAWQGASQHRMQQFCDLFYGLPAPVWRRLWKNPLKALKRLRCTVPFTVVSTQAFTPITQGMNNVWLFGTTGSCLLQTKLSSGRYYLSFRGMALPGAELYVSGEGCGHRRIARLGSQPHDFLVPLFLEQGIDRLTVHLVGQHGIKAWVGDFQIQSEIEEPALIRLRRNLGTWARRNAVAHKLGRLVKRIGRSEPGRWLRQVTGIRPPAIPVPQIPAMPPASLPPPMDYELWRQARLKERARRYAVQPEPGLFSLLTTVWDTPVAYLDVLARSVLHQQDYPSFEWVILDNGSTSIETRDYLEKLTRYPQVKLARVEQNLGIIGGMRHCLERATGRYILPVDSDDYVYPDCLKILAWHIRQHNSPPLLYSDEDMLQEERFYSPYLKPDWDPVLFLSAFYMAHINAIDRELARKLDVYGHSGANGSHDWDTFMRFMLAGHTPVHVPEVLYSWRVHPNSCAFRIDAKPYIAESHRYVLGKYLASRPHAERYWIDENPFCKAPLGWWFRREHREPRPLRSLVFCRESANQDVPLVEIHADYAGHSVEPLSLRFGLKQLKRHASEMAKVGGLVHFILGGMQLRGQEWPWEVLTLCELHPDTVMVGGRVLDGSDRVITGGEYLGMGGDCRCPDVGRPATDPGYGSHMWRQRSVSAVSTMLAVVDAAFLLEFLERGSHPQMSLPFLGAWLGAYALRTGKRVVYSADFTGVLPTPVDWDNLISPQERQAFVKVNRDIIPDYRFYSRHLSLDLARAYTLTSPEQANAVRRAA